MRPTERTPYPGLRSFTRHEIDIFFGRDDCIDAMLERLCETRFLAVLGPSGSGKSSLVKTGLLSALEMGLVTDAGTRWRVGEFTPGRMPLRNLARSLLEIAGQPLGGAELTGAVEDLRALLEQKPQAIVEWSRQLLGGQENLLLLVDQFEELFRYQDYAAQEEAEAFVRVLLESAEASRDRLYVTLTMRSEYLGPCALIEGLAEAISAGMFLIPRMSREQCREAIEGPAKLCGGEIDEPLGNRLLNDLARLAPWEEGGETDQLDRLARRADQLPLLQYTLNRMWLAAAKDGVANIKLTLDDYEKIGGLEGALNAQANDIFQSLDENQKAVAEAVFRALTEGTTIADAKRRPAKFANLVRVWGDEEYEIATHAGRGAEYENVVRTVIETFAKPGCDFLKLDPGPEIVSDTVVDITHESIIRQWRLLSEWVKKEADAGLEWRRLKSEADRYKSGRGNPLSGQDLASVQSWWNQEEPNKAWAARHGGGYEAVATFIADSIKAQKQRKSRQYAGYATAGLLLLALVGAAWFATATLFQNQRYATLAEEKDKFAKHNLLYREAAKNHLKEVNPLLRTLGKERLALADTMSEAAHDPVSGMGSITRRTNEFLDKKVRGLIEEQVRLIDGLEQIDSDDPELVKQEFESLALLSQWVSPDARDETIERYNDRAVEIFRHLNNMDAADLVAGFDVYAHEIDRLDRSDTERPHALESANGFLEAVGGIDPSRIAESPGLIAPTEVLLYLTSKELWRKGSVLKHLNQPEEAKVALQKGLEKIEAWRRSTHRPCPDLAGDLHNDLGSLLTDRADAEYQNALDCEMEQLNTNDSVENRRWVAIRATRLADAEKNARKFKEARGHYQLAIKFRRMVVYEDSTKQAQAKRDVAAALRGLGNFEIRYGEKTNGVSYMKQCIETMRPPSAGITDPIDREAHGLCERGYGLALRRLRFYENGTSTLPEAETAYRAGIDDFSEAAQKRDETEAMESVWAGLAVTLLLDGGAKDEAAKALSKSFDLQNKLLASAREHYEKTQNKETADSLADTLSYACWDAILNGKLDEAVSYAEQAAQLASDPSSDLRINWAHAYLLAGRIGEARRLYLMSKDRQNEIEDIAEDFAVFAKLGLGVPAIEGIQAALAKHADLSDER